MIYRLLPFLTLVLLLLLARPAEAAVAVKVESSAALSKKELRKERRMERRQKRMERRMARWSKRLEKWQSRERSVARRTLTFVIGGVCLIGGLVLGIISFSNPLGGFFHFLAGLLIVTGIILILFAWLRKPEETEATEEG